MVNHRLNMERNGARGGLFRCSNGPAAVCTHIQEDLFRSRREASDAEFLVLFSMETSSPKWNFMKIRGENDE
mgnify:CR=1 FL=1